MAMMTVRNLPDEVKRALRVRAAKNGRSTEAEVRIILEEAVKPKKRLLFGEELSKLGREAGLTNEDFDALIHVSDQSPAEPMRF